MVCDNPIFPPFLLSFGAFVLLTLITFSVPFIDNFYFLWSNVNGGIKFGVWGWCYDIAAECLPKTVGYSWDPQIVAWMTNVLVFFPVSAVMTLFTVLSLLPSLCTPDVRIYPAPMFSILALMSFVTSLVAFAFTIAQWTIARNHFRRDGFDADYGPLVWMSLAATVALFLATVNSGCGTLFSRRLAKRASRISYHV